MARQHVERNLDGTMTIRSVTGHAIPPDTATPEAFQPLMRPLYRNELREFGAWYPPRAPKALGPVERLRRRFRMRPRRYVLVWTPLRMAALDLLTLHGRTLVWLWRALEGRE